MAVITVWNLMRALSGLEAGRACRGCGQPIAPGDHHGMSEAVCAPCRREAD